MGNSQQALHSTWYLELRCRKEEGLSLQKRNPRTQKAQGFWFPQLPYCKWPGFLADRELSHRRLLGLGVKGTRGPFARALWILVSFVLREKLY